MLNDNHQVKVQAVVVKACTVSVQGQSNSLSTELTLAI